MAVWVPNLLLTFPTLVLGRSHACLENRLAAETLVQPYMTPLVLYDDTCHPACLTFSSCGTED